MIEDIKRAVALKKGYGPILCPQIPQTKNAIPWNILFFGGYGILGHRFKQGSARLILLLNISSDTGGAYGKLCFPNHTD